jgi:diadenosine tetraphosphate (Ap4A) HIT family hydrolase
MKFETHPNFSKKPFIKDLNLCRVLMNDKADFPWIFLIPMRPNIKQIDDLCKKDQYLLIDEIEQCSKTMEKLFRTDRLNVAALGNITPQLHVHIICRHKQDPYWPDVIWNKPMNRLEGNELDARINLIKSSL